MKAARYVHPPERARKLIDRYGIDGAMRYARAMESRYWSDHWFQVLMWLDRFAGQGA
jgi:hypothetical protein